MNKGRTETTKDNWRTPPEFVQAVCRGLGISSFWFDATADAHSSVAPLYTHDLEAFLDSESGVTELFNTPCETAASLKWSIWCNPPFNLKNVLMPKLITAVRNCPHVKLVMIVPVAPETALWRDWVWHEDLIFLDKRIKFLDPETGKAAPGGAMFPCALLCLNLTLDELRGVDRAVGSARTVFSVKRLASIMGVENAPAS